MIYLNKVLQMFLMVVLCWSGTSGLERAWIVLGEVFMPLSVIVKNINCTTWNRRFLKQEGFLGGHSLKLYQGDIVCIAP